MSEPPATAWHGLWHATPLRRRGDEWFMRALLYLVTPLIVTFLFGQVRSASQFAHGYGGAFVVTACVAGSFDAIYHFVWPRVVRRQPPWGLRIAGHAVTLVGAVWLGTTLANTIGGALFDWQPGNGAPYVPTAAISVVVVGILIIVDEMDARNRDLAARESAARVATLRAELAALQARTDPHFLFNSLNSVAALIPDDPVRAEQLLERLAAVFRYALDAGRRERVSLASELAAVRAYLDIETVRLGDRLRWRLDCDADHTIELPPLVLQPLVENAVRHGAGGRRSPTEVVITVIRRGDELQLAVEDHAIGNPVAATADAHGSGSALTDLGARLELAYSGLASLDAGPIEPAGWRAAVTLPLGGA